MAYEHLITADWHNVDVFPYYASGGAGAPTHSSNTARTGTYSFAFPNGSRALLQYSSSSTKYFGIGLSHNNASVRSMYLSFCESDTPHITLNFDLSGGNIEVRRGSYSGTVLTTEFAGLTSYTWFYVTGKIVIDDSSGIVLVRVNDQPVINLSGIDTRNGGSGVTDNLYIKSDVVGHLYVDDIKIKTDSIPNVGGLEVVVPDADGGTSNWTASVGTPYECVNEVPPTFDDYIGTNVTVLNTKQTFTHAGLPQDAYVSIPCVVVVSKAKLNASGTGNVRMVLDSNGTASNGTPFVLTPSAQYIQYFVENDPATSSPWTKSGVDNAEFGVETI